MSFKPTLRYVVFIAVCATTCACGLMPANSMSNSEEAKLNLQMGVRYLDMGMLEVAQEKLDTAYNLEPRNPEILNALGVFYERIKEYEKAEEFYQSAINKDNTSYYIKNNYGRFLCERGQYEKGMLLMQESLDDPMNNRTWLELSNIGICYIQQNDAVQGEEYFRRALQINPAYAPALLEMLKISYNKQQYMSARAFLERYQAAAKHTPESLWLGFQTERALGNRSAAENYKEQLMTAFPTSKQAQEAKTAISK
ncbi:type IV pilus biogenesis/stability protein PilW [Methylomonas lenta]|uniref:Type IV pilus biogenesis/stability protein PilW n=2 Tax=Methylomonas lenta TaxID=980561 RepID=A0A177N6J6_9GAMM|nr:type IV pilus biogenesis/stability protein PilW [Methylomonas lenta]OAI13224.1 type IV pilus biogenesis/stability protein PilW [Methylomonas lenta]